MNRKVLITISGSNVAPRFDKTSEIIMFIMDDEGRVTDERTMVLHQSSPEDLCQLIISEGVHVVVCGGIEEEYYDYLKWKKLEVFDGIMGPYSDVVSKLRHNELTPGQILFDLSGESADAN
jgi:predicted Fe-Mo cluster-binding NifX family protein